MERSIDAALDQPRQSDTGKICGDQREKAEDEETAVALDEKLDAVVVAKNCAALSDASAPQRAD
jgi:hypothetical protein